MRLKGSTLGKKRYQLGLNVAIFLKRAPTKDIFANFPQKMTVALLRLITLLLSIAQWTMSMSQMRAMCEENQKRSSSWKPLKTWQQTCGCAAADCSTVQEEREKQQQLQNCLEGVDDAPQLQQLHWRLQGNPITAQLHCCAAYRGVRVLGNLPAIGIICAVALAGYGNAAAAICEPISASHLVSATCPLLPSSCLKICTWK